MALSCWYVDAQWSLCLLGSAVASVCASDGWIWLNLFCSFKKCLGTTKQRLMAIWTCWRRPQGKTWTLRMKMAWLPPYWLLSMDVLMLFSSYAAESKHDTLLAIICVSSHVAYPETQITCGHSKLFLLSFIFLFWCSKLSMSDIFGHIVTLRHANINISN